MAEIGLGGPNGSDLYFKASSGEIKIESHRQLLYLAHLCVEVCRYEILDGVEEFHRNGWTLGRGDLRFNRSLDVFYMAVIDDLVSGYDPDVEDGLPSHEYDKIIDFHYDKLREDIWKEYYSPEFLKHPTSAQFYRLPNLRDLRNVGASRNKGIGNFASLPRWSNHIYRTIRRQHTLPGQTMIDLALSTLRNTKQRQQKDCPRAQPYSDTHAWFWLNREINLLSKPQWPGNDDDRWWLPDMFAALLAGGDCDIWDWEAHFSPERWAAAAASETRLGPDMDGTRKDKLWSYRWSDGGRYSYGFYRAWEPEVGSEEEVAFDAAVAAKETEGVPLDRLDYSLRSHILLAILHAAFTGESKEMHIESVKKRMVQADRIGEDRVDDWVRKALALMEPYAATADNKWPDGEHRDRLLENVLFNNGQLFARWGIKHGDMTTPRAAVFDLGPSRPKRVALEI